MSRKNRILCMLLCVILCVLVGCGTENDNSTELQKTTENNMYKGDENGNGRNNSEQDLVSELGEAVSEEKADNNLTQEQKLKQEDVAASKAIKTCLESVLFEESAYDALTGEFKDTYIEVTESGLEILGAELKKTIMDYMAPMPKVHYKEDGQTAFYFTVNANGVISIYVGNEEKKDMFKLSSEVCDEYK